MPKKESKKQLTLKRFDITSISDNSVVVFIGKRQTGKSFLVKDLLYYKRNIPVGTVISATEGANEYYSKIFPKKFIHDEYDEDITKKVLDRQKLAVKAQKNEIKMYGKARSDARALYLLDDCMYDSKSWNKSKNIRSLFMNGRHFKILFLLTMQYALGIPPNLRTNIDYIFLLRENLWNNRKRLYDNYAGMFPTYDMFCKVFTKCTEDYHCLVIKNNAKSNKLEDQVFWYKAKPHTDFKVGNALFWQHNYDDESSDEEDYETVTYNKKDKLKIYRGDYEGKRIKN